MLVVCIIASALPGLSTTALGASSEVLNISFNDYVTNSSPSVVNVTADNYYIDEYTKGNKALKIMLNSRPSRYYINADMIGETVVSFDIAGVGQADGALNLYDGGKSFKLLQFDKGSINAYNGNPVGGISKSRPTNVAVVIDFDSKMCDIYINSRLIVSDYRIISDMTAKADKIEFNLSSEYDNAYVLIDNINIHKGSVPYKQYPQAKFLEESVELDLNKSSKEHGVYANADFEFVNNLQVSMGNDYKTWYTEEDGNRCLELKQNKQGAHFGIRTSLDSSGLNSIVLDVDIKLIDPMSTGLYLSVLRSESNQWSLDAKIDAGALVCNGRTITRFSTKDWTKVSLVNKLQEMSYDIYVNDNLIAANVPYSGTISKNTYINQISTLMQDTNDLHILIDNYKLYEGDVPQEIPPILYEPLSFDSVIPSDEAYEKMLKNSVALHLRSGVMLSGGKKNILEDKPFVENGRTLIPVRAVSEAFDIDVDYDSNTSTVYIGNDVSFVIGSDELVVGNNIIKLDVPAKIYNSRAYLPLRALCEKVLDKKVFYDDSAIGGGMIIISDDKFIPPSDEEGMQQLNDYILYVRPDAQRVYDEYKASPVYGEHPRIMINKTELSKLKEEIKGEGYKKTWAEGIIAEADSNLNKQPPVYESYDGTRMSHEASFLCVKFGMAYLLTNDSKYVDAAWNQLKEVCSWMDWNPSHYLDLGEHAADVALAYDWLYQGLNTEQRKFIEEGLYRNAVMRSAMGNHGLMSNGRLYSLSDNWSFICSGGVFLASVALLDVYPEICSDNISQFIHGTEAALKGFAPDGGWHEGPGYWGYAMTPFLKMIDTSIGVFGTEYGLMSSQGLSDTAAFRLDVQSAQGSFNFADSDQLKAEYPTSLIYLSDYYNEPGYAALALKNNDVSSSPLYALLWLENDINTDDEPELALDSYYEGIQIATMRSGWMDSDSSYVAWVGGLEYPLSLGGTAASHHHLDSGSFIYDALGERWALEMGRDSYLLSDYGNVDLKRRFKIFRLRAEGHNTIIINPDGSGVDRNPNGYAKIDGVISKEKGAISTMDMTETLSPHVSSAKRGLYLTDNRKSLVVRDELLLKKDSVIYWHMYTKANAKEVDEDGITLEMNGKTLRIDFVSDADFEVNFEHAEPMEGMPSVKNENSNVGINKIRVKITGSGNVNFTAKLSPQGIYTTPVSMYDMPISDWVIPDGSVVETPQLDMIYVDGTPLDGFDKFTKSYSMDIIEGTEKLPVFTAIAKNCNVEVITPETYNEPVKVKLTDVNDETNFAYYGVSFKVIPKPVNIDEYDTYNVSYVKASHEPQAANSAINAIDGDLSTRWAAEGRSGVWLEIDIGKICSIDTILISTMGGDRRQLIMNIEMSDDGKNWKMVYDGKTSGRTEKLESVSFDKTSARYIRLNCFGTTEETSNWQSINEFIPALKKQ